MSIDLFARRWTETCATRWPALLRCGERHIVVDLKQVTRIDAAGVGELARVYNMARAVGATVQLVNPSARVRALISRVGLADVLLADQVAMISTFGACARVSHRQSSPLE